MYPYGFVAGPNKHDNLPVSSPSRKLSQIQGFRAKDIKDTQDKNRSVPSVWRQIPNCTGNHRASREGAHKIGGEQNVKGSKNSVGKRIHGLLWCGVM